MANESVPQTASRKRQVAEVIHFPRPMKRGAKVRRGPCAEVLQFPVQLSGDELRGRFDWMNDNQHKWENEETEGVVHLKESFFSWKLRSERHTG